MAAKSSVEQVTQLGIESVAGTAVPATRRPSSYAATIKPTGTSGMVRASGSRFQTRRYKLSVGTEGTLAGVPDYNEQTEVLAGVFAMPTTVATELSRTAGADAVLNTGDDVVTYGAPYTHTYTMGDAATFTVRQGDDENVALATHCFVTDYSISFGRNSETSEFEASLSGGLHQDGQAFTADSGIVVFPGAPASPLHVDVYLDPIGTAYGTTKLANVLSAKLDLPGLRSGRHYLNSAQPSIGGTVANPLEGANVELVLDADAGGRSVRSLFEDSSNQRLRLQITDPATGHYLRFDTPVGSEGPGDRDDDDNAYVVTYTLPLVEVGTERLTAVLRNNVPAPGSAPA